ncbi:hypothetical protein D9756_005907 [Leucocoprinus leucothites]|uniref:Uncharacterized protein n=1 Tax=Leucocoprinus leucothites TaxID=201217 RepID=A0A8H5D4B5_9AGAR|nr:hypothetical protein D9756_005907 [Leucoagaricus leucothites]
MRLFIFHSLPFLAYAIPLWQRDLGGLFGGDNLDQPTPDLELPPEITLTTVPEPSLTSTAIGIRTVVHTSTTAGTTKNNSPITSTTQPLSTATTEIITALAATSGWTMSTTTMTAPTPVVPEAPTTSAEEATQWKVIGIGIITVGLIATVILSIIFFDSWWHFVCDLFCGRWRKRGKNQGQENMVPDWETRDWEFKLANEDGHRYPTISSLADITEGQGRKPPRELKLVPISSPTSLSPKPAFWSDMDSAQNSGEEPLTRKPSTH